MHKEDTSLMNACIYWKQDQGKILDDKTSSHSTPDVIIHSMFDNLKMCCQEKMDTNVLIFV